MKKNIILLTLILMISLLGSCAKTNTTSLYQSTDPEINIQDNQADVSRNDSEKDSSDYTMNESNTDVQRHIMFNNISFDSIMGTDRESRTSDSSLIISGNACKGSDEFAVCIATIETIDKYGCNYEKGQFVPITLRIDSVIESTSSFSLEAGDSVTVAEFSTWFKNEVGYTVSYYDGIIPITEEESQYILYIYEVDENVAKNFWSSLKYRAEALTIPVSQNHELTDIEIYEALNLPDDVIQCSKDLIDSFMNKQ